MQCWGRNSKWLIMTERMNKKHLWQDHWKHASGCSSQLCFKSQWSMLWQTLKSKASKQPIDAKCPRHLLSSWWTIHTTTTPEFFVFSSLEGLNHRFQPDSAQDKKKSTSTAMARRKKTNQDGMWPHVTPRVSFGSAAIWSVTPWEWCAEDITSPTWSRSNPMEPGANKNPFVAQVNPNWSTRRLYIKWAYTINAISPSLSPSLSLSFSVYIYIHTNTI